ncbi:MAG: LPS-assembly protein LptD [Panacagrimonas sp.]
MRRSRLRLPTLVLLALCGMPAVAETPPEVVEAAGCSQLQLTQDAPEIKFDDRLILNADKVLLEQDGLSTLAGMVTLSQGDKAFSADALNFDDVTRIVTVKSESLFRNTDLTIKSSEARFDLNAESGAFLNTEFSLPGRSARGRADRVELRTDGRAYLQSAAYTTCAASSDAWYLEASEIKLDHDKGLGSARNARLRFLGVPILYTPYLQFPIDDRRRSGLLYPTIGQASGNGLDLRWPVYLNLAPNYDATFNPRYLSNRGFQSGLDFRYLFDRSSGSARYEYLDDEKFNDRRSLLRFDHLGLVNDRLGIEATYAESSDRTYFEDLGGTLSSSSITHLEQTARATYQAPASYTVQVLVQNFQPIATNLVAVDDPYKRLPQIRFDALTHDSMLDTRAGIDAEFVNFAREDSIEGARLNLTPYLRFERESAAWYVTSQADLHHTTYELSGIGADTDSQPGRTAPVFSAEAGLNFERLTSRGTLQLLQPRAFALYVPYRDQDDLPLFDTGEPDFDFVQVFARNRFSGEDRLSDAQHIAGAATLREIDPNTGNPRWTGSVGQLFRFKAPRVDLCEFLGRDPGTSGGSPDGRCLFPAPDRGATEFIAQFDWWLTRSWSTVTAAQWSPKDAQFERTQFGLRYRQPEGERQMTLAYRYRRDLLEQADFSFLSPVYGPFKLAGRTRFSLADSHSRENYVGIEYGTCCWALRTSYRRFISDSEGNFDNGVYVQLELKGLARIGGGQQDLLPSEESSGNGPY